MFGSEDKMEKRLQEEKNYIWIEIEKMKKTILDQSKTINSLSKNAPEHFKELQVTTKNVSYYKNRTQEQYKAVESSVEKVEKIEAEVNQLLEKVKENTTFLIEQKDQAENKISSINEYENSINNSMKSTKLIIESLKNLSDEKDELEQKVEEINTLSKSSEEEFSKIKSLVSASAKARNEIKELHNKVFGYTNTNESGDSEDIEGLSTELENSYKGIKNKLEALSTNVTKAETQLSEGLLNSKEEAQKNFKQYIEDCDSDQSEVMKKINSLLPDALTAGLAGAYEEKINKEEIQLNNYDKAFNKAIYSLILISFIPIVFNVYRISTSVPLAEILKDIPLIIAMMLPLYMPVLWVAYSSSKKYKLSKRLIEEYTHKGVLSKTFEGLSKQVQNIKEDDISQELRNKLLFNLIDVNSENPGKLISDYNKSDHPLMEALDKSSQLADALSKVERIPVLSSLVKHFADKQKKIIEIKNEEMKEIIENEIKTDRKSNPPSPADA